MRKALLIALLIILTSCNSNVVKENTVDDISGVEKIEKSKKLTFTKYKDSLTEDQLKHFEDFYEVKNQNGDILNVKMRLLDKDLVEIYAVDEDSVELRKTVTIIRGSNPITDNPKLIEKPQPVPKKEYR